MTGNSDAETRSQLLDEGRRMLAEMSSDRPELSLDDIDEWTTRVLDWASTAHVRVPSPGAALRTIDAFMEQRSRVYVEQVVAILAGQSRGLVAAPDPGRAFISYVREDSAQVDRLADELRAYGARIWLDRDRIQPGRTFREAIRSAITSGSHFIWCNSDASLSRSRSYANEELTLAIDELRMRSTDQAWFVPVKLTATTIPDRDIGGGRRLSDLQWVDLSIDWHLGVRQISQLVAPLPSKEGTLLKLLEGPDIRARTEAARKISGAPDPRLLIPLCEFIQRSGTFDTEAVYWVGCALQRIRDNRAVPVLIDAILRGIGHEYKLIENLESLETDESRSFLAEFRSAGEGLDKVIWLNQQAGQRGITR